MTARDAGASPAGARTWGLSGAGLARLIGLGWAVVQFQLVFGFGLVSAQAPYWKSPYPGDMLTNLAGAQVIWRAPWSWPPTVTRALLAPEPLSIVYTDSLPWVTLAFKALGLGHAHAVSLLGGFLLASYLLQPIAMIALMGAMGERRAVLLAAGAILGLLTPAWLGRQFGHIALTGHWLILFALALAVAAAREGLTPRRIGLLCLLGALACGIHAYFVPPLALIALAAAGAELSQRRPGASGRAAAAVLGFGAAVALSVWVLAYSVGEGVSGGAEGLAQYAMNLLTPVWPHPSALAGEHWNGGWFTGGLGTPRQQFEALNWLGAGALLAVVAALVTLARGPRPAAREWIRRFGPLVLAMIALTAWAVGPEGSFGPWKLWDIPLPGGWAGALIGVFRAHGRFFWAPAYLAVAASLVRLAGRVSRRLFAGLALGACVLQLADQSIVLEALHVRFSTPDVIRYPVALDSAALDGRPWRFVPRHFCAPDVKSLVVEDQLVLLAARRGGNTDTADTARPTGDDCRVDESLTRTAPPGDPRITVALAEPGDPAKLLAQFSARTDCRRFAHGLICGLGVGQVLDGKPGADPALRQPLVMAFDHGQNRSALGAGWSGPEAGFTWSDGPRAEIVALTPLVPKAGLRITVQGHAYVEAGRKATPVELWSEGRRLALWQTGWAVQRFSALLPAHDLLAGAPLKLELRFPAAHPGLAARDHDGRELGFALERLEVAPR